MQRGMLNPNTYPVAKILYPVSMTIKLDCLMGVILIQFQLCRSSYL